MDNFIKEMAGLVAKYQSPLFNSIRIAQIILESDWGRSELFKNANNPAGMKAGNEWTGDIYIKNATEQDAQGNEYVQSNALWRKFPSLEDGIKCHAGFLSRTAWHENYYRNALNATTVEEQAGTLQGTYATDVNYKDKLMNIITKYNLKQYDKGSVQMAIKKPKRINERLMAVGAMGRVMGVIIHNDYGSRNGTPEWYIGWLRNRNKELGIAHYYIDRNTIARVIDSGDIAYHAGNYAANTGGYVGFEVCQSRWDTGADTATFLANEDMTLRQAAAVMKHYKLPVNRSTVRLHKEFSATSCPHRSWDLHGKTTNSVKDYFIKKIKYYMSLGDDVNAMIDAENKGASTPVEKPKEVDLETVTVPKYSKPSNPFKEMKVGDKVTIRKGMSYWYIPAEKHGKKPSKDFTGTTDVVDRVLEVNAGYSKRAYLLKGLRSWILEQDLVEPRADWVKVDGEENKENTTPPAITADGEGYFYLEGVKYKVSISKE